MPGWLLNQKERVARREAALFILQNICIFCLSLFRGFFLLKYLQTIEWNLKREKTAERENGGRLLTFDILGVIDVRKAL